MNIKLRLLRRPITSSLWLLLCAAVSAFLLVGLSLWYSTTRLSRTLDESHTAIAVRTDPSIAGDPRYFTQADKDWFEALPSVKAVRSHTVSAAVSSSFSPLIEINRAKSYRSSGNPLPYCNAVFIGMVNSLESIRNTLYIHMYIASEWRLGEEYVRGEVEAALNYQRQVMLAVDLRGGRDAETYFKKGDIYMFSGMLDPAVHFCQSRSFDVKSPQNIGHLLLYEGYLRQEGDTLRGYLPGSETDQEGNPLACEMYSFPAALRIGSPEDYNEEKDYFADPFWEDYFAAWEKQQHSLPVVGTDRLESLYAFLTGRAIISEGRSFTAEEYAAGAKVLILSEKMAARQDLKVGDTLRLCQYMPAFKEPGGVGSAFVKFMPGRPKNNPTIDLLNLEQTYEAEEEFTLVGIYKQVGEWSNGTYDFTPNTVFIPRSAQIGGAVGAIPAEEGGEDVYGLELSIELVNGKVSEFMLTLDQSPYTGQFYPFDQGYEEVQKNINSMAESMLRLLILSAASFVLFLALYLLMFQGSEKKTLGTMRSLGNSPRSTAAYLFGSGFLLALPGVIAGTLLGGVIMNRVQANLLEEALAGIEAPTIGSSLVITEEALTEMVRASSLAPRDLVLLGAGELLLIALLLLIQAVYLSRRNPRRLMEG
ncbi:MAG: ABC transporter permease [Lachnospiraceae bacterium]|nr:ABC transporter permease [Lachnospiraceae bacterium]